MLQTVLVQGCGTRETFAAIDASEFFRLPRTVYFAFLSSLHLAEHAKLLFFRIVGV